MHTLTRSNHQIGQVGSDMAAETGRLVLIRFLKVPRTPAEGIYLLFGCTHHPYELRWAKQGSTLAVIRADETSGGMPPKGPGYIGACTGPGKWIALVDALFVYTWPASGPEYERMLAASKKSTSFARDQGGLGAATKTGALHQRWTLQAVKTDPQNKLLGALITLTC